MSAEFPDLWQFGEFRLDVRRKVLWHGERSVPMPLKELEVLSMLVRNRGELVTKNELLDEIWQDSFVEESNLSRHIYLLRKTLKDLGADKLIENVPRRGYRFTGEVRSAGADEILLERHTRTRTLIEFQDEAVPIGKSRRVAAFASLIFVIAAGASAFFAAQYLASKSTQPQIGSIAVLPFKTLGTDPNASHAGAGLADILTTRLSNLKDLKIRPASAVARLEDQNPIAPGERLQVDAVLEGAILYVGDRVRVTARLVRTSDASIVWTGEFEKLKKDELQLQNDLALQIVKTLAVNISGAEKDALAKRYTDKADAFDLYVRGRHEWNKRTGPGMIEAERLFRNAIAADPGFALAHVGLADTMGMNQSRMPETQAAIARALELDPALGEAHASYGFHLMFNEHRWQDAETAFRKSVELNPNYATAHQWFATLLAIKGQMEESKSEMQRAVELDPLSPNFLADLGQIHYFAGEYAEAEKYCRKALEIYPDFAFAHQYLYYIYLKTGDHDRAIEEIIKAERIIHTLNNAPAGQNDQLSLVETRTRKTYSEGGIHGYAGSRLADLSEDSDVFYFHAINRAIRGENEEALEYLEKCAGSRAFFSAFVKADPVFEGLRSEPRYQEIIRKMGLS